MYLKWKESKRQVDVPADFSARVMDAVTASKSTHPKNLLDDADFDHLVIRLSGRWATAAALLLLGLFRLIYWAGQLFGTGTVAP